MRTNMDSRDSDPLLSQDRHYLGDENDRAVERRIQAYRAKGQRILSSRTKHFVVMGLVAVDVMALLGNVFIELIACKMHQDDEPWVRGLLEGLEAIGLIISCLFMVELISCLVSFGPKYLSSWFQLFDSAIIVVSFIIDVASRGLAQSIGSLVVVLRLWRLAKLSEELVLGASERMDLLEQQLDVLHHENMRLKAQLGLESAGE